MKYFLLMFGIFIVVGVAMKCDKVLISYVFYRNTTVDRRSYNPELSNLMYFIRHGISPDPCVDIVFSIVASTPVPDELLTLEKTWENIRIRYTKNYGDDLCVHRDTLTLFDSIDKDYSFIVFLNCGVRGPLSPSRTHPFYWITQFTRKLNSRVKLTGSTISCQVSPHVQTWFFVMSSDVIRIAIETWKKCQSDEKWNAVLDGEVGLSKQIFMANYTISSNQQKHKNEFSGSCTNFLNPTYVDQDISEFLFFKFGGGPWRERKFPVGIRHQIEDLAVQAESLLIK
jgi:hypothetical protein